MDLQQGDPIEQRYKEYTERGPVIDQFIYCINSYREAAVSSDPKFDHIDLADKQKVWINLLDLVICLPFFPSYAHPSSSENLVWCLCFCWTS